MTGNISRIYICTQTRSQTPAPYVLSLQPSYARNVVVYMRNRTVIEHKPIFLFY